jgi:hypothetical protein
MNLLHLYTNNTISNEYDIFNRQKYFDIKKALILYAYHFEFIYA